MQTGFLVQYVQNSKICWRPPRRPSARVPVDDGQTGAADLRIGPSLGLMLRGFLEDTVSRTYSRERAAKSPGLLPRYFHLSCRCLWRVETPMLRSPRLILSKRRRCGSMAGAQMGDLVGGFR